MCRAGDNTATRKQQRAVVYSREELLQFRDRPVVRPKDIPVELRRKRRGTRAGALVRKKREERKWRYKPVLPSVVMGNVRSLTNKTDELSALVSGQREYRECSLLCFTETWLNGKIPDCSVELAGFSLVRADREKQSGKKVGGGLAVFVNSKWCNPGHVTVKATICTPDIELLAVGLRPYYLPREFSVAIVTTVYIPPSAVASRACDVIHSTVADLQTRHPSALLIINGDFNHVKISKTLTNFTQYVTCSTRGDKTLDLLYANVKEAYSATALPPLGRSDHCLIQLTPTYKPVVRRQPITTRTIQQWSVEAEEALMECYRVTDWELFQEEYGDDIEGLTQCVTDYIKFCEECVVPNRKVRCFPNNKPWINRDIKALLNRKKRAFMAGDTDDARREIQRELKRELRRAKDCYKNRIEEKLQKNDLREVWGGVRSITGMKKSGTVEGTMERANELNQFFNRFDSPTQPEPPSTSSNVPIHTLATPSSACLPVASPDRGMAVTAQLPSPARNIHQPPEENIISTPGNQEDSIIATTSLLTRYSSNFPTHPSSLHLPPSSSSSSSPSPSPPSLPHPSTSSPALSPPISSSSCPHPPSSLPPSSPSPLSLSITSPLPPITLSQHTELSLLSPLPLILPPFPSPPVITTSQVRRQLAKIRTSKARGPDDINPRVLKVCAEQLAGIFRHLFNLSLRLKRVPRVWKTSCIVPVPKKGRPSALNDFRPVALTSHVMKTFERLVLQHLRPLVRNRLDPLQFAYQADIGVEDAIIYLLHRAYSHLEKPQSTVRIMFFDFSSAFNTIRPLRLAEKLSAMQVDQDLVAWITDYLTDRPQYVRLQGCLSDVVTSNTGAPQGTVLSPFLFTLYTSDFCFDSGRCHLQKFSDDSSIVGCITDDREEEYRDLVENFIEWCDRNHLQLNIGKTKELVVDFRRSRRPPTPVTIRGEEVEMVNTYKFLGVHLNNKLDWSDNTEALYRKGQSRLFFLRRLRSFNVCTKLLQMFYQSVVASVIFFAVVCWGGGIGACGASKLGKLVRKAGSVVGMELDSVEAVTERMMRRKLNTIMDNPSHPLWAELTRLRSSFSHRLIQTPASKRLGGSFVPSAIRLYNATAPKQHQT